MKVVITLYVHSKEDANFPPKYYKSCRTIQSSQNIKYKYTEYRIQIVDNLDQESYKYKTQLLQICNSNINYQIRRSFIIG